MERANSSMSFATEEPRVAQVGIGVEIDRKVLWVVLSCSRHLKGARDEEKGSDGGSGAWVLVSQQKALDKPCPWLLRLDHGTLASIRFASAP